MNKPQHIIDHRTAVGKNDIRNLPLILGLYRNYKTNLYHHSVHVAKLSSFIAEKLGYSDREVREIFFGGLLHDFGKLYIPLEILNKPGKLSDREYSIVRRHTEKGYLELRKRGFGANESVKRIVLEHHERLDGSGYPYNLTAEEIYIGSKIIMVADVITAIFYPRAYSPARPYSLIRKILREEKGTKLSTKVVEVVQQECDTGERLKEIFGDKEAELMPSITA